ncbi:type II secretion system F family protein [uncultured Mobiluncus sp.]|uniref:type II secretion system F family protein n=1 Tax=uncultured Mobiluncus sp. TaxID=293425 RepID=UPI0025F2F33F|nr:type II secretion system F family protein [uncultured Mobiluncus sp.]
MQDLLTWIIGGLAILVGGGLIGVCLGPWIRQGAFPTWRITPYVQADLIVMAAYRGGGLRDTSFAPNGLTRFLTFISPSKDSVERRLQLAGLPRDVRGFRRSQLRWAVSLGIVAAVVSLLGFWGKTLPIGGAFVMLTCFVLAGLLIPDYRLTGAARRRQLHLNQELPDVIELLALAVGAGEPLYGALHRVSARCTDVAGQELEKILAAADNGDSLAPSLTAARARNDSEILAHLIDAIVSALERGSPLAGVLRSQVADSRAVARTQLLTEGGKKEVLMMVPVVFLILPLTVVFALYPGLVALQL